MATREGGSMAERPWNRTPEFSSDEVYKALDIQAHQGTWLDAFSVRSRDDDPWDLDLFNPKKVVFTKPAERADKITALRATLLDLLVKLFISEDAWDRLGEQMTALYTDPALCDFMERRRGNLFIITPHVQFHDLGFVALKSLQIRADLPKDNPFAAPDDPARDQCIVLNRVLSMLDHDAFRLVTGVPLLEGLLLPMCDVVTTISSNGSGRHARRELGSSMVSEMNQRTSAHLIETTTRGGQIVILAPSGAQASLRDVDRFSKALVVGAASAGTERIIVEQNRGSALTHRNAVAGIFLDCPSITPAGEILPIDAGVRVCPEVYVPTEPSDLEAIMRATIRSGIGAGRKHGYEFRYGNPSDAADLKRQQLARLDELVLTRLST